MGFFKESTPTSSRDIARLHALIWILIYGGLLTLVLGLFTRRSDAALGRTLMIVGALVAAVGVALIYVRSRLKEES
ncbi:MAG: hypothetical protein ABI135_09270 [Rhodoferax sp.]